MVESHQTINANEVYGRELEDLYEAVTSMEFIKDRGPTSLGEASLAITHSENPWSGTETMNEAIDIARYGWAAGRLLVSQVLDEIDIDALLGNRSSIDSNFSVSGDECDVDRFLTGEPENMVKFELSYDSNGKIVDLFVNCSMRADVQPEQIMKRGAALLTAREILVSNGYSMGITMVESCSSSLGHDTIVEYRIPLLEPGEYLDIDTAAFCLAHPAFLRRLVFALNEREPDRLRRTMGFSINDGIGGYGRPHNMVLPTPPASIIIDAHEGLNLRSSDDVIQYTQLIVKRSLEKLSNTDD